MSGPRAAAARQPRRSPEAACRARGALPCRWGHPGRDDECGAGGIPPAGGPRRHRRAARDHRIARRRLAHRRHDPPSRDGRRGAPRRLPRPDPTGGRRDRQSRGPQYGDHGRLHRLRRPGGRLSAGPRRRRCRDRDRPCRRQPAPPRPRILSRLVHDGAGARRDGDGDPSAAIEAGNLVLSQARPHQRRFRHRLRGAGPRKARPSASRSAAVARRPSASTPPRRRLPVASRIRVRLPKRQPCWSRPPIRSTTSAAAPTTAGG